MLLVLLPPVFPALNIFFFNEAGLQANSLVFFLQLWIMQTELPLSREHSESAKVLLTACLVF